MKTATIILFIAAITNFLCGCSAVYFAEYEKYGLVVEGKPDASEPVSGSVALRQHVVLVTPGRKSNEETCEKLDALVGEVVAEKHEDKDSAGPNVHGTLQTRLAKKKAASESVSVLAYYDFQKLKNEKGNIFVDRIIVRSAFITGDAARSLSSEQATDAMKAMTSIPLSQTDFLAQLLPFTKRYRQARDAKDQAVMKAFDDVAKTLRADSPFDSYPDFLANANSVPRVEQDKYIAKLEEGLKAKGVVID